MGRHSRKGPAPKGSDSGSRAGAYAGDREAAGRRAARPDSEQHAPTGYAFPQTRGGHPEQHEAGGGWGAAPTQGSVRTQVQTPVQNPVQAPRTVPGGARIPGPRQEFIAAFDEPPRSPEGRQPDPYASVTDWNDAHWPPGGGPRTERSDEWFDEQPGHRAEEPAVKGGKGRTVTGIAAAAVTTVLAVVVAGQVAADSGNDKAGGQAAGEGRDTEGRTGRSDSRPAPPQDARPAPAAPRTPSYAQLMAARFPIDSKLTGSGEFEAVPGFDKAPGKGRKIRYRIDVEKGLGLDPGLFAKAVQTTLNDERSWAHGGAMTFERISSGEPKFVITLASPGTTDFWCAKSGLDTSVDKVSCDSAATERVMINGFRWAQGAETYGAKEMFPYRQMLINHEVGHRLGYGHVNCNTAGALAPVMQQQTKSLDVGGVKCRPNPWVHPDA